MNNSMSVKILNCNKELESYKNIKYIRIISKKYNLLIMKDYLPIIGEIEGSIDIEGDVSIKKKNIKGYYMNKNNEMSIVIKEEYE